MNRTIYENGLWYELAGDYYLPLLTLSDEPDAPPLGHYGRLLREHLRTHRPILYSSLLTSERLFPILREADELARNRLAIIGDAEVAREVILHDLLC
jgi:2-polyprenyl-6-methoxyphenol hydroxylase-like FAD-dependent oxidoreductase